MSSCSIDRSNPVGDGAGSVQSTVRELLVTHHAELAAGHVEGRQRWGGLSLPLPVYAERVLALVLRRLRLTGDARPICVREVLQRAALADLFLAIACDQDLPGAWERLHEVLYAPLLALARRRLPPGVTADEVVVDVIAGLLVPPAHGEARRRIGTYDGTGSLLGWSTAILVRALADRGRGAPSAPRRIAPLADVRGDDQAAPDPISAEDPLAAALDAETATELRTALQRTWSTLTPQQALVLALRYRDGVPQTRIAKMLAVSESRVSRVLASAVAAIRAGLEASLGSFCETDPDRLWRALHAEFGRRLQESTAPADHRQVERAP